MKYLKFVALMLCVAVSATVFNACSKDDKTSSTTTNTNAPTSVADTEWEWYDPEATDVYRVQVEFNGPMLVSVIKEEMVDDIMDVQCYLGNYTYSNGSGTLSLSDDIPYRLTANVKLQDDLADGIYPLVTHAGIKDYELGTVTGGSDAKIVRLVWQEATSTLSLEVISRGTMIIFR